MSGVKNWLMEMQEYSWHLLDAETNINTARETFITKYGETQLDVFDNVYHYQSELAL